MLVYVVTFIRPFYSQDFELKTITNSIETDALVFDISLILCHFPPSTVEEGKKHE